MEHIAEEHTQESLAAYYAGLTQEQRHGIEAVAMDMWEPYIQATRAQMPEADKKIVFDRFHIMGHLGKAVDTMRKQEHRDLMTSGDERLKDSKYLWLYRRENVPKRRREKFAVLIRQKLKGGRGPLKKRSVVCGTTPILPQTRSSGSGGISMPRTAGWNLFGKQRRRFADTSTTS